MEFIHVYSGNCGKGWIDNRICPSKVVPQPRWWYDVIEPTILLWEQGKCGNKQLGSPRTDRLKLKDTRARSTALRLKVRTKIKMNQTRICRGKNQLEKKKKTESSQIPFKQNSVLKSCEMSSFLLLFEGTSAKDQLILLMG